MANMTDYIRRNRKAIDRITQSQYKNDTERRLWILNDEGLYNAFKHNVDL